MVDGGKNKGVKRKQLEKKDLMEHNEEKVLTQMDHMVPR